MSAAVDVIAKTIRSLAGTNSSDATFRAYADVVIADLEANGFIITRGLPPRRQPMNEYEWPGDKVCTWTPPEMGEDEDYVEYLGRAADFYRDNPPPAGEHLVLVECDAEPRHWPMYEVKTDDFWPAPCQYCVVASMREQLNAKERQTHWMDHPIRGRLAKKLCGWAYTMGIISGYGITGGGPAGCRRCIVGIRFKGRRPYILGRERR